MDNQLNEIRRKIRTLRAEMLELEDAIRVQVNDSEDCSGAAQRLMGMSRNLVGLIRIRDAMGGAEVCPDVRLRQINRYIGGRTVQR
jgi:predicted mannosyl-3-phosphoglycerate phosphatase (HAD superfamily)